MDLDDAYHQYQADRNLNALLLAVGSFALAKAQKRRMPDAEALAQDIVVRVWETFAKYDPRKGGFRAWVATLTNNYLSSCHRSAKRQIAAEQEPEDRPMEALDIDFREDQPVSDFGGLSHDMHKIAVLLTLGYDKADVAEKLRCSVRTVERIIARHIGSQNAA